MHQQGALNSLLTTIPNRNYHADRGGHRQIDREQRIQLQRPLLSSVDRRGERANSTITTLLIHMLPWSNLYMYTLSINKYPKLPTSLNNGSILCVLIGAQ